MLKNKNIVTFITIAISIVFLVGLVTFFSNKIDNKPTNSELGTCKTPEEAYLETQKALNLLSENINVGMKSVEYINEYEKTKNKIFKDE